MCTPNGYHGEMKTDFMVSRNLSLNFRFNKIMTKILDGHVFNASYCASNNVDNKIKIVIRI